MASLVASSSALLYSTSLLFLSFQCLIQFIHTILRPCLTEGEVILLVVANKKDVDIS